MPCPFQPVKERYAHLVLPVIVRIQALRIPTDLLIPIETKLEVRTTGGFLGVKMPTHEEDQGSIEVKKKRRD